jgi:uncharacterized protein YndB with AHSA1/START domain
VSKVYAALSTVEGVAGWWTKETTGQSKPGGHIDVRFLSPDGKAIGWMTMEVMELGSGKKVHWRFTAGPEEWIGTDAILNLSQDGEYTIVLFGHKNWRDEVEFTAHCSMKWVTFLLSLRDFVQTRKGQLSPHDMKIDNWN